MGEKNNLSKTLVLHHFIFLWPLRRPVCVWPHKLHYQILSNNNANRKKTHKTTTK